ncbi:KamA family radical SAM protein [candidate division KSB1 bacterium]
MTWKNKLKENICTIEQLKKHIKLTQYEEKQLQKVISIHPMSITKYYLSLINKNDENDPIKKIIIPSTEELDLVGSYGTSFEKENTKTVGLQHKYAQTALLLITNKCAAYCRYCFRKRLVGLPNNEIVKRFSEAVEYIKDHKEINNVLISGGDSLMLPTDLINKILKTLSNVPQLNFIRFGSRIPVVFPDRILEDKHLLKTLKKYSLSTRRIYIITHFDHPREITEKSIEAVDKLIKSNVILNNQAVLLKDVNDNPDTLAELHNKLAVIGINPYYVFQCRPVKRVKNHFPVPLYEGYNIVENAKKKLNGLSKRFRYVMSHRTGKIEIVGIVNDEIYLKYLQAKNPENAGVILKRKLDKTAEWLDDLEEIPTKETFFIKQNSQKNYESMSYFARIFDMNEI